MLFLLTELAVFTSYTYVEKTVMLRMVEIRAVALTTSQPTRVMSSRQRIHVL